MWLIPFNIKKVKSEKKICRRGARGAYLPTGLFVQVMVTIYLQIKLVATVMLMMLMVILLARMMIVVVNWREAIRVVVVVEGLR